MYLTQPVDSTGAMMTQFAIIGIMFAVLYFFMIRPQKKREKEVQIMRSNLDIGDEIVTIGGIIGTIVSIKDETILIETGSDRNKMRIARWAIQTNVTGTERAKAAAPVKASSKKAEKAEKSAEESTEK